MSQLRIRYSTRSLLVVCFLASLPLALYFSKLNHSIEQPSFPNWQKGQVVSIFDASGFVMTPVDNLPLVVESATVVSNKALPETKCQITMRVRLIDKFFLLFAGADLCVDHANGESDRLWVAAEP